MSVSYTHLNTEAIQVIKEEYDDLPEKKIILDFIEKSARGIVRGDVYKRQSLDVTPDWHSWG